MVRMPKGLIGADIAIIAAIAVAAVIGPMAMGETGKGGSGLTGMAASAGPSVVSVERAGGWLKNTGSVPVVLEREIPGTAGISGMMVMVNETVEVGRGENVTATEF